ncbi:copper resistance protein [Agrobacterium rubi]|uniref:plastocyanin/azurin family copper-binding protein n=1 Tax=Agrobacterium rubi TaxID=28099 RepID=UPI001572A091|nr:plastocyanin/azurin family copper-binding protein [Agrobacterium rubi]NTF08440.1 copper resistance protein [Agrobacterium rubi]NTF20668.1 copper resistance protein [Agrobacterium rubi]NTF27638.1 copper resistance protein [Agrobacterium rubi]
MRHTRYTVAIAAVLMMASQSFAATIVKVTEGGEGGGPMTLTLDKPTIKSGETTFLVHNDAMSEEHEMVLVKLKSPDQTIDVVAGKNRIDEKKLKSMGEVSDLKPGANGQLKAKLSPGSYVLLCNIKGHYQAGMHAALTVTK